MTDPSATDDRPPARVRVLIVDDDPDLIMLLGAVLSWKQIDSITANDGAAALRRIEAEHPDLILLDLMMPVMDGWKVLERMAERGDETPILVVSAKSSTADIVRALQGGATEYLTKPFDPGDLVREIERVTRSSPDDREAQRAERLASLMGRR
jgi:DNA-binding response OmpR family regulator